ncbi:MULTISPECIES: hypothetical protein [Streptomyces]|uniref:hypothetical protein n=1 Tax=Streptomyces TaxID=1883 RepID=UPI0016826C6C|nr:hypothetical protein [Streptomyces venezuelae]
MRRRAATAAGAFALCGALAAPAAIEAASAVSDTGQVVLKDHVDKPKKPKKVK